VTFGHKMMHPAEPDWNVTSEDFADEDLASLLRGDGKSEVDLGVSMHMLKLQLLTVKLGKTAWNDISSMHVPDTGFLATRVLPGAIGHSILRTSVKPRCIPLSNSQDPELVLLSSHLDYPSGIDPGYFDISTLKNQILGKGGLPYTTPMGGGVGNPPPRPKSGKLTKI